MEKRKKILVVDDDDSIRNLLIKRLELPDVDLISLSSGKACLDYFEKDKADLILIDYMMPGLNGVEVIASIRQRYSKTVLPIIMVTSKDDPRDMTEAFKNGANDYLTKPVFLNVARFKIQSLLEVAEFYQNETSVDHATLKEFASVVADNIKPKVKEIEQKNVDNVLHYLERIIPLILQKDR